MTLYGKGITVASGFDLAGAPVDHKAVAETTEEMQSYADLGAAFSGLIVFNKEDGIFYYYNGTSFQTLQSASGAVDVDLSNYVTLDTLQTITGKKTFSSENKFLAQQNISAGNKVAWFQNNESKIIGSIDQTNYTGTAAKATKLANAKSIALSGDVTGSASFDGTADASITATLTNSGVTTGTYPKVTVDAKGRVTKGASLAASDIPNLTLSKITDAGTAASKDIGSAAGNVPVLDTNGKLDVSVLPAIAVKETFVVSSQAAMLALTAQEGDMCIRTDLSKTYILQGDDPSVLSNWIALAAPTDSGYVISVNGKTGAVTVTTSEVTEGSNLYYTDARATANFNTNVAKTSVRSLSDGADVLLKTDKIIINCGGA